jgi:hypothetical protein
MNEHLRVDMKQARFLVLLVVALALGMGIAWVDTRPTWDDTGITATVVFGSTLLLGAAFPRRAWVWAIAVGIWIPVFNVVIQGNVGAIASLAIAFAGSYAGVFLRKMFSTADVKDRAG